eukprot:3472876-Rhodomonas_salina.1
MMRCAERDTSARCAAAISSFVSATENGALSYPLSSTHRVLSSFVHTRSSRARLSACRVWV